MKNKAYCSTIRNERKGTREQFGWKKKGFIFSERDKVKKKKEENAKRDVFCRLNYSVCLGNSSFSFM